MKNRAWGSTDINNFQSFSQPAFQKESRLNPTLLAQLQGISKPMPFGMVPPNFGFQGAGLGANQMPFLSQYNGYGANGNHSIHVLKI